MSNYDNNNSDSYGSGNTGSDNYGSSGRQTGDDSYGSGNTGSDNYGSSGRQGGVGGDNYGSEIPVLITTDHQTPQAAQVALVETVIHPIPTEALATQTLMDPQTLKQPEAQEASALPTPVAQTHMGPATHRDKLVDMVEMTPPTPRPDTAQATPDQTTTTITTAATTRRMTQPLASC